MHRVRQRGQVFLILTILVVSFMIGITSVLLDIKQSDFIEPAPDANQTFRAWEITVDSLNQIMEVHLSEESRGVTSSITQPISNLEDYLRDRGLSASITITAGPSTTINDTTATSTTHSTSASFSIFISSSSTEIDQDLDIELSYTAEDSSTSPGKVVIQKELNGETEFMAGCSVSGNTNPVTDNGDGTYSVSNGETLTFVTPTHVEIIINT